MARKFNFSAGPAVLPEAVLKKAAEGLVDYKGSGMGIAEISHRSKAFIAIMEKALGDIRELLQVPADYDIALLQGGASLQFSMVPMNLLSTRADYLITGHWAAKAHKEAGYIGSVRAVASSEDKNYSYIPKKFDIDQKADYFHITSNNTIYGTQFRKWPKTGGCPLVVDASSDIFSERVDFTDVGLIYAGAQKNIGPSGVVLVIIRKDLAAREPRKLPEILRYKSHIENQSMCNTPPTFAVYMLALVMDWVRECGGVDAVAAVNAKKAALIYSQIDKGFYTGTANKEDRSRMNITFTLPSEELTDLFIDEAAKKGLMNLKGYRTVGGIRASVYNAMSLEGVSLLADFMGDFAARKG